MKTFFSLVFFLSIVFSAFCQITSFKTESFKDYEDKTRVYYINIEGVKNNNQADKIRDEMMKMPGVLRFTFHEKFENLNKCMIQCNQSLTENEIYKMMNDILINYQQKENQINEILNELPQINDTGNPERDKEVLRFAILEWIKNNPEKYAILNQAGNILNPENPEKIAKDKLSE